MPPLVTIITPVFNRSSFLRETILSVVNQDYPRVEYLLLDDGSSDDSLKIMTEFAAKHPIIALDSHENMGETRTVNKGFSMARGEIIGVVNSDDPLLPGAISAAADLLSQKPEVVGVYPDWLLIDERGSTMQYRRVPEYSYINMLKWHHCMPGPGTFFRRSLVEQLGGRDEKFKYVADFDFWLQAGLVGPLARNPKTLATFRWHSDGISSKEQGLLMAQEHIRLMDKLYAGSNVTREMAAVKRQAYSSAYYEAAIVLGDTDLRLKRHYFARALGLAPATYLLKCRSKLPEPLVLILLGMSAYSCIKDLYRSIYRRRQERVSKKIDASSR